MARDKKKCVFRKQHATVLIGIPKKEALIEKENRKIIS